MVFSKAKQLDRIEEVQEKTLRFVNNDYQSDYASLIKNCNQVTMEVKRMKRLCIEIHKTMNGLNPI